MSFVGNMCFSRGVNNRVADDTEFAKFVWNSMRRYQNRDWGDSDEEDSKANDDALKYGSRVFAAYKFNKKEKIWIITEADRSITTVLFPSEY